MKNIRVVIDRFEGPYAVCEKEDRTMMDIKRINIPIGAKEGYVLKIEDNNIISIDQDETKKRADGIKKLTKDLWK
ncbi:hypothetical protein J2Z42_000470 [Clostridium algifaecis]|uniref:DUF3006 domain-containing protein n=1 Tax=Clostridium algifaecis TaxID=1472040 RepID=A0ABS4KQE3_9CLOT|nr:DUF3006 domain-containing protein [Clostridium algifaecis]MBP2031805.1 hypothetical protein [Clostridium algifaecis]